MLYRLGRNIYALAIVAFGVISLAQSEVLLGLEPIPAAFPGRAALAIICGMTMLVAGLAMRARARFGPTVLSVLFTIWLLSLHVPTLVMHPTSGAAWTTALELVALWGIALVLMGPSPDQALVSPTGNPSRNRVATIGRLAFAISLAGFGALHFVYAQLVSGIIPDWFPFRLFLTYAIGVAFVAAGLSIASGIKARLAGTLLGVMFAIWVVVLHIPSSIQQNTQNNWTSLFIAVAMCGGSFVIAGLATETKVSSPT